MLLARRHESGAEKTRQNKLLNHRIQLAKVGGSDGGKYDTVQRRVYFTLRRRQKKAGGRRKGYDATLVKGRQIKNSLLSGKAIALEVRESLLRREGLEKEGEGKKKAAYRTKHKQKAQKNLSSLKKGNSIREDKAGTREEEEV